MQSLNSLEYRKQIIDEILGSENERRKAESFRRFEIYNKKQAKYIEAALKAEFPKNFHRMRKITSVNIATRIIDETAQVYKDDPVRKFYDGTGQELTGDQADQAKNLYALAKVNERGMRANRIKRFQNQCILQIVPKAGKIEMRAFHPHQLDCIHMEDDPTIPFAFVITEFRPLGATGDGVRQKIADRDDGRREDDRKKMRFVFWSAEHNMRVNGLGEIIQDDPTDILNPIGELPFYDISDDKEGAFWVDKGSNTIDFAIDFGVMLSDTANISRMQGHAQGVWYGKDKPSDIEVGPHGLIYVPQTDDGVQPKFEFVNPSPDLVASMDLLDRALNIHLTSEKVDPKVLNSKGEARSFASGFERLLALYEKFDASKDDLKIFAEAEQWIFKMLLRWSNAYQNTTGNPLVEPLKLAKLPEDARFDCEFARPEMVQTKTENEDSALKLHKEGVMSLVEVVMEIRGVDEKTAIEIIEKIIEYRNRFAPKALEQESDDESVVDESEDDQDQEAA